MIKLGRENSWACERLEGRKGHLSELLTGIGVSLVDQTKDLSLPAQVAYLYQFAQALKRSASPESAELLMGRAVVGPGASLVVRADNLPGGSPVCEAAEVRRATEGDLAVLGSAVELAESAGWASRISLHVGLLVITGDASDGVPITSWTNPYVWQTVHQDMVQSRMILSRDLVHEATHLALNSALESCQIKLDTVEPLYYSPWKSSDRPQFGYLHSIVSFVTVVDFLISARPYLAAPEESVCENLIVNEIRRLSQASRSIGRFVDEAPAQLLPVIEPILTRLDELLSSKDRS